MKNWKLAIAIVLAMLLTILLAFAPMLIEVGK